MCQEKFGRNKIKMFELTVENLYKLFDENNKVELTEEEKSAIRDKDVVYFKYEILL